MKFISPFLGVLVAGCLVSARPASAQADTNDFKALEKKVDLLGDKVQKLEQTHEADQKKIEGLQQQLGETQTAVTNATQKTEEVARVQSAYPVVNASPSPLHNFSMVGDAEVQFGKTAGQNSAFTMADFAPIFLFRASDNVLFEAGFDIMLQNNTDQNGNRAAGSSTSVNLSFAQLDYLLNDHVTVVAGDMVLPLGTYSERAAGWLNKIPDDPFARGFLPGSGVGVQLRGAVPLGESGDLVTYSVYGVNGPSSSSTNGTANAADLDLGGNVGDTPNTHGQPSGGGRIGWFHTWQPHYDVELGLSGQTGPWSDSGNQQWSAAVLDGSVHISPFLEVKGEYINTFVGTDDMGTIHPRGWWVQAAYKLAGLNLDVPYLSNVELVNRYDQANDDGLQGAGAAAGAGATTTERDTIGFVYYFSNTLLLEGDYEFLHSRGPNALPPNSFVFQLSYGF